MDGLGAGGGVVLLPPCSTSYIANPPLTIETGGITIHGAGSSSRVVVPQGTTFDAAIEVRGDDRSGNRPTVFESFLLTGRPERLPANGIAVAAPGVPLRIDSVVVQGFAAGLAIVRNPAPVSVRQSRFADNAVGVVLFDVRDVAVRLCRLESCNVGLAALGSSNGSVSDCRFLRNGFSGLAIGHGSRQMSVSGCDFVANGLDEPDVPCQVSLADGSRGICLSGSDFDAAGRWVPAMRFHDTDGVFVVDCRSRRSRADRDLLSPWKPSWAVLLDNDFPWGDDLADRAVRRTCAGTGDARRSPFRAVGGGARP